MSRGEMHVTRYEMQQEIGIKIVIVIRSQDDRAGGRDMVESRDRDSRERLQEEGG
jgi:hypothetical protein